MSRTVSEPFAAASFLSRWRDTAPFDLSGSDSETLTLSALLALADDEDRARWERIAFSYAEPAGARWLRAAIARRHQAIDPDDVVCCAGAQEVVTCVTRALLSPGDHAVVVLPIYRPSEEAVTGLCDATGIPLEAGGWQLDIGRVADAIRPNTKLVLMNFPNSPTGAVLDAAAQERLVGICRHHGVWLVNDEIYGQTLTEPDDAVPAVAEVYERGVSINGLSKGFGLPGLRVGWAVSRDAGLRDRIVREKSRLSSCISSASEVLAHIALKAEGAIVPRTRAIGCRNRQRLQDLMSCCAGTFALERPRNVAFGFPRYLGPGNAEALAERLARDVGVLLLPSAVWASPLADVRTDHVRIGLGHARNSLGLDRLQQVLPA